MTNDAAVQAPAEAPRLAGRHISKRYGHVAALDDVSLDFRPGLNGIIGDNGAGKSTLLKIFSGVVISDGGAVLLDGQPTLLTSARAARAAGIESLYQDLALVETMSIADNIFLGRERRRSVLGVGLVDRRRMRREADHALEQVRIHMPGSRVVVKQLSGGQRQAVAITRAMLFGARVVLLDEPTAALGPKETSAVLGIVRDMADRGETVVMVGHNLPQMLELADSLIVMRAGRIVATPDPGARHCGSSPTSWSAPMGDAGREASCRRLTHATAIVTGGASGIGAASARRLASEGATVLVADVRDGPGEAVVDELRTAGHEARYVHCDVARSDDWLRLRAAVDATSGRLDVLHGNAYLEIPGPAHELEEADWDRQLAVTLKAAYFTMRTFAPMLEAARGSVVFTSSVHALVGMPDRPAYAAAKGGLEALTRQLAVEYGPSVRINAVVPGPILTRAWDGITEADRGRTAAGTALGRLGEPEEVAAAVAFLASPDSSFVTGANLVVDGGWSVCKDSK